MEKHGITGPPKVMWGKHDEARGFLKTAMEALSAATNRRLLVQAERIPSGIRRDELVFGVPEWRIINAAFCFAHPQGARFRA
jgi:DUF438 domain-containing protein